MAKVYSDDLRRKLLEAHQRVRQPAELAARFSVSVGWQEVSRSLLHNGKWIGCLG